MYGAHCTVYSIQCTVYKEYPALYIEREGATVNSHTRLISNERLVTVYISKEFPREISSVVLQFNVA